MIDMNILKQNKGVIIFYLLLIVCTFTLVQVNTKNLDTENRYDRFFSFIDIAIFLKYSIIDIGRGEVYE